MKFIELSAKPIRFLAATKSNFSMWPLLLFALLYAAAFETLVQQGHSVDAMRTLRYVAMFATITLVTTAFVKGERDDPSAGRRLWLQFLICGTAIVVTGIVGAWFGSEDDAPLAGIERLYGTGCWQYIVEVCAVFAGLHALGLRGRDLGLRLPPVGSVPVAFLWIATATGFLTVDVLNGVVGGGEAVTDVFQNIFRNGFSEEFLFRGVLFSRLRLILRDDWALFAQAVAFGMWHYGADIRAASGNLLVAICFMVTVQGVFGYALGFLALRTRSIAIGSVFHAIADATSII